MPATSRTGRKIARRACDLCRDRRVQCTFEPSTSSACRQCLKSRAPCTFLTGRKPRGPRRSSYEPAVISAAVTLTKINRRDDDGRRRTSTESVAAVATAVAGESVATGPLPLPIGAPTLEHLVPEAVVRAILDEFSARVYPVIPLVHLPSFTARLRARDFESDPAFYRLCMALCAVTVASIPRNGGSYGSPWYRTVGDLIDRAAHLILISSMATAPEWQNRATLDNIIVYVLLALSFHYSGRPNAGWAYASEAMQLFRALELYKEESYAALGLGAVEAELCKRAFWLLFIIQVHDRMSFVIPHTGLSYDPKTTDWEFLLPLEVSDEALMSPVAATDATSDSTATSNPSSPAPPPTISGFIALIKVFLCVADLLDVVFPGPPAHFSLSPGSLALRFLPVEHDSPRAVRADMTILDALLQVMTRMNTVLNGLADELRPVRTADLDADDGARRALRSSVPSHFEIMRANIHITSIYIQSMIIEMCLSKLQGGLSGDLSGDLGARLWQLKDSVARELLEAVTSSPTWVLESNGSSMITKIREIAATLLDRAEESAEQQPVSASDGHSQEYLTQFVQILADLDHLSRNNV